MRAPSGQRFESHLPLDGGVHRKGAKTARKELEEESPRSCIAGPGAFYVFLGVRIRCLLTRRSCFHLEGLRSRSPGMDPGSHEPSIDLKRESPSLRAAGRESGGRRRSE